MLRVLIVDDDLDGAEPLRRFLENVGYEAILARDGRLAIQLALSRRPDIILLDLFMPKMDGVRVLEVLRSYMGTRTLHVIVLTAFPESLLKHEALALGVTRVLTKGHATFPQIEEAIRAQIDSPPWPGADPGDQYVHW